VIPSESSRRGRLLSVPSAVRAYALLPPLDGLTADDGGLRAVFSCFLYLLLLIAYRKTIRFDFSMVFYNGEV
jgi:hypothetical protein